jgi:hypothetical protein
MGLFRSFFGEDAQAGNGTASAVDVVIYMASLASDPKQVDPLLDGVRTVTARLHPGQALSLADLKALAQLYLQLENYLLTKESLRAWDKATLAGKVKQKFPKSRPEEAAFWQAVNVK